MLFMVVGKIFKFVFKCMEIVDVLYCVLCEVGIEGVCFVLDEDKIIGILVCVGLCDLVLYDGVVVVFG